MPNFYKAANKRYLHKRSHLTLEFPQSNGRALKTFIPFLENPQIEESKSSNLADYNLLGRSNTLYAYMGAKSREINVTFRISLLHLLEIDTKEGLGENFEKNFKLFFNDKEVAKQAFQAQTNIIAGAARVGQVEDPSQVSKDLLGVADVGPSQFDFAQARSHREYYQSLVGIVTGQRDFIDNVAAFAIEDVLGETDPTQSDNYRQVNRLIDLVLTWVNLIRATTLNNSNNTTQGPPIVRLTHGPLYNNIPCIADSYSLRVIEEAGYDVQTLTPRQLEVNLTLKEYRAGNFGTFEPTALEDGDNHVGWEGVVSYGTTDPYNGVIPLIVEG